MYIHMYVKTLTKKMIQSNWIHLLSDDILFLLFSYYLKVL